MNRYFYSVFTTLNLCVSTAFAVCPAPENYSADFKQISASEQLVMRGDHARIKQRELFQFEGNASLSGKGYYLTADSILYQKDQNKLDASGAVTLFHPDFIVKSEQANLDFMQQTGRLLDSQYYLPNSGQRGYAKTLEFTENNYRLSGASYTSCTLERTDWELRASYLNIRPQQNTAIAHNVRLKMLGIPVLYIPWVSVPLEGRKSGFLAPEFSYSEVAGADIKTPYYLNLAPDYDATLAPRWIQNRGQQMSSEVRWMARNSAVKAQWEYLHEDALYQQQRRQFLYWRQHQQLTPRTRAELLYQHSSDPVYFHDLGSNLASSSQTFLERRAVVSSSGKHFQSSILLQDFQRLETIADKPYQRLPAANLKLYAWPGVLMTRADIDYTYFHQALKTDYHRAYISPTVSMRLDKPWAYLQPDLSLHYHQFSDRQNTHHRANIADVQIHSGLFFDRASAEWNQSLEPELHWIWKQGNNQSSFPLFESRVIPFRPGYVLDGRRYSGRDRTGDTHFVSAVLGHRITQLNNQVERLHWQVGYMAQLKDETDQLGIDSIRQQGENPGWISARSQISHWWRLYAEWILEPLSDSGQQTLYQIDYTKLNHNFSAGYFSRDGNEQISLASSQMLTSQWQVIGRATWSFTSKRFPEALAGFQYNNCCWNLRLTVSQFQRDEETVDTSIGLQLELKGFSSLGQRLDKRFTRELLGYSTQP